MSSPQLRIVGGAAAIFLCALAFVASAPGTQAQESDGNFGVGSAEVFLPKYLAYRAQQLNSSTPHVMRIRLGNVKGLSTSFTGMHGEMAVDPWDPMALVVSIAVLAGAAFAATIGPALRASRVDPLEILRVE